MDHAEDVLSTYAGVQAMSNALRKPHPTEDRDLEARNEAVRSAIASARLEGVDIAAPTQEVFDDYASGIIDGDEMMDRVLGMYGPGA